MALWGRIMKKKEAIMQSKKYGARFILKRKDITDAFDGTFNIENRYHFTNINQCQFTWKLVKTCI